RLAEGPDRSAAAFAGAAWRCRLRRLRRGNERRRRRRSHRGARARTDRGKGLEVHEGDEPLRPPTNDRGLLGPAAARALPHRNADRWHLEVARRAKSCGFRPGRTELRRRETRSPVGFVLRAHWFWVGSDLLYSSRASRPAACSPAGSRRRNASLRRRFGGDLVRNALKPRCPARAV